MGGTLLTIHGRFFDQTDQPARVLVGGNPSFQKLAVSWQLWQQQTIAVFWKTDAGVSTKRDTSLVSKDAAIILFTELSTTCQRKAFSEALETQ